MQGWRRWSAVAAVVAVVAFMQATGTQHSHQEGVFVPSPVASGSQGSSYSGASSTPRAATAVAAPTALTDDTVCQSSLRGMFDMTVEQKGAAMQRVYDAMGASGDPRVRAAGLLFEIMTRKSHAFHIATDAACQPEFPGALVGRRCYATNPADLSQETMVWTPMAQMEINAGAVDQLAKLAAATSDPAVYAFAMHACRPFGQTVQDGACSQLSVDQWARIDPGNAVVWLHAIDEAQGRGDRAALSEALYRMSQAQTSEYHLFTAGNLVVQNLPAGIAAKERTLVEFGTMQATAFWALPRYAALAQECRKPAIADVNRAQVCERIAEFLVTRDTSAIGMAIGRKLGEELGWPTARLRDIQLEEQASMAQAAGSEPEAAFRNDCSRLKHARSLAVLVDQLGEVKAGQELARRSGMNLEQLKARHLATQAARAAASAAPPASGAAWIAESPPSLTQYSATQPPPR